MDETKDGMQKEVTTLKSRRLKRKSEEGSIADTSIGKTSQENERPSPKLRKFSSKLPTVVGEKQTEETEVEGNHTPLHHATENVPKPSQLTHKIKSYDRCKERKKPLVPPLGNLDEDRESSKLAAGFILSPRAERPYKCNCCGKQFKYFSNLKSHMKIVHKKVVEASPKDNRDLHITVGSGQVFQCEICFRDFKYFSNLRTHRLVHTSSELGSAKSQVNNYE